MKHEDVRRVVIVALAADDQLAELLVLKGGNALGIVHRIGERASLDVDYSIESDFHDLGAIRGRIDRALQQEFQRHGLKVIDTKMTAKPDLRTTLDSRPTWGGWAVEFKLVTDSDFERYSTRADKRRHVALELNGSKKAFQIDISKYEFVDGAQSVEFDGYKSESTHQR